MKKCGEFLLLLVPFLSVQCFPQSAGPLVTTFLGGVRGSYKVSDQGRSYKAYEGIPYAEPPLGQLRFEPPRATRAWRKEWPATEIRNKCLQYLQTPHYNHTSLVDRIVGDEDCLYLNIYVPIKDPDKLVPVIFWIHGGCFQFGGATPNAAKYVVDKNVILVTINYRLGPLGFLSTEDQVVPGNMGLKDQSQALRWVSENIKSFGGDPSKIILAGSSAGGASVHYHYMSPASAGLFKGGISHSGTALDAWTQTENSAEKARKLGSIMECPKGNSTELINCLKNCPAWDIVAATKQFMPWLYNPYTPFGPVVEKTQEHGYFINKSPIDIIMNNEIYNVSWITGVTKDEGLFPAADFINDKRLMNDLSTDWENLAPALLDYQYTAPPEKHAEIARKIRKHYYKEDKINATRIDIMTELLGDRFFKADAQKAAMLHAKHSKSPVWFFKYSYRGNKSLSDFFTGTTKDFGVSHADETRMIINSEKIGEYSNPRDVAVRNEIIDIWVSLANNGIPKASSPWLSLNKTEDTLRYLNIFGPNQSKMESSDNFGEASFWSSLELDENNIQVNNARNSSNAKKNSAIQSVSSTTLTFQLLIISIYLI